MDSFFKKIVFLIISFFLLVAPILNWAITIPNPLTASTFEELIQNLIDLIFWLGVILAPLMVIIAAFYFITSGGNPERIKTAKQIIFGTMVGLLIILLAKGVISMVRQILEG